MGAEEKKRGGQRGAANGRWTGGDQQGICLQCGCVFTAPKWELKRRKYCSRSCGNIAKIIPESRKTRPHVKIIEKINKERIPEKSVVHHRNGNHNDNRPENLILCKNQAEHKQLHMRKRISDAGGNPDIDKICSCCRQVKPKIEFHKANKADGYRCYCKACQSKKYLERKFANGSSNQISSSRG